MSFNAAANDSFEVSVLSSAGKPLKGMIVEVVSTQYAEQNQNSSDAAVVDQIDQQFVPHVLIISKNQGVSFPNSDNIKHHVYSFSSNNVFERQLYKGQEAEPVTFENPGLVELGCNIHDWMLGYIYVAQSDLYGVTDDSGKVVFNVSTNLNQVYVWHPLLREDTLRITQSVEAEERKIVVQLTKPLATSLSDYERFSIDAY